MSKSEDKKIEKTLNKIRNQDQKTYEEIVDDKDSVLSVDRHFSDEHEHLEKEHTENEHLKDDVTIKTIKRSKVKFKQDLVNNDVLLSVRHLKQYFFFGKGPARTKLKAVHDVSFDIKKGECFGLVGESGCGKTTTGRSIIKLYQITSGSIYYKGYRISAGSRWNEKEIKFTKIRLKKALNELKKIKRDGSISSVEYEERKKELEKKAKDIIDVQKEKIAQIKYDNKHVSKRLLNEIQMIFQDPVDSLDPRMTVEDIINEGLSISRGITKSELKQEKDFAIKELNENYEKNSQAYEEKLNEINIKYENEIQKISKKNDHHRVVEVLNKVGLIEDYANRYPHEFSGGQRQRIGIARALIMNPQLLICDEPISALDVSIRAQIINLLNDLKDEMGLTILFIAHDLSVVKYFCDRIAVMYFGELVELATSDELFKHPLHPYTKSLLSAIPKPNPLTEKNRVRIVYNPKAEHDYTIEKPRLVEILPNHFVLANNAEIEKYNIEIKNIDSKK